MFRHAYRSLISNSFTRLARHVYLYITVTRTSKRTDLAGMTCVENPSPKRELLGTVSNLCGIDNARFIAAAARLVNSSKLNGPYGACIATYGSGNTPQRVVVSIVDMKHHLVNDHRTWLISEYSDEAFRSIDAAVGALIDDIMDYCERSQVGRVFVIDELFPLNELQEKCPFCGKDKVRTPWQDQ